MADDFSMHGTVTDSEAFKDDLKNMIQSLRKKGKFIVTIAPFEFTATDNNNNALNGDKMWASLLEDSLKFCISSLATLHILLNPYSDTQSAYW